MNGRRIKSRTLNQTKTKSQGTPDYNKQPPIFSLEKVLGGCYCFSGLDSKNKACFADAIYRRRGMTWGEILRADRHGLGTEKISESAINAALPDMVGVQYLALRYNGKRPMVGYRQKNIFFVLWFDHDFTLYDH